jgi:carbon storage regulator CsrA
MLVLSRYKNEGFVIRCDEKVIRVTICDVLYGGKVRIGVDAPSEVKIVRDELLEREPSCENRLKS